ncbi:MAG: hypothetical protein U1F41_05790 [Burkholderiales bacterium]
MTTFDVWLAAVQRSAKRAAKESAAPASAVVVKESSPPSGWRFVPTRDDRGLIVEIIATPLE